MPLPPRRYWSTSSEPLDSQQYDIQQYLITPGEPTPAPQLRNREVLQVGSWVMVTGGTYQFTRPGSYGIIVNRQVGASDVVFLWVNHPDYDEELADAEHDRDGEDIGHFTYIIDNNFLRRLEPEEITDNVVARLSIWEELYDLHISEYIRRRDRSGAYAPSPIRTQETISDVIKRLHTQQQFYKEHKDDLPSWTPSDSH